MITNFISIGIGLPTANMEGGNANNVGVTRRISWQI